MNEYFLRAKDEFRIDNVNVLLKKIKETQYDFTKPVPEKPEFNIFIDNKGISLPGSLISVYGLPKSRKSIFLAMIVSSMLSKEQKFGEGFINSTINNGQIIWFDTEQSEIELKYFQDNVIKMAGLTKKDASYIKKRYKVFNLRPFDEIDRLVMIDEILMSGEYKNIKSVIIDGIADLMYNVNDLEMSKKLVTRLLYWADTLQIPIFTALHTNKDGVDATGSLGGFLNKKASYTVKVSKNFGEGPSRIEPYYIRTGEFFKPFTISNDEDGLPVLYDEENEFDVEEIIEEKKEKRRKKSNDYYEYEEINF